MINLAIFASGTGSNARRIMEHFQGHPLIRVALVVSNKPSAGVLKIADEFGIAKVIINRESLKDKDTTLRRLGSFNIDFIALAGFLLLIPKHLVQAFPSRIVNIHPALLPDFGGKGMYGMNVHRAVKETGVEKTGMTIHFVNEKYDEGETLFQAEVAVKREDSPEIIAKKVLALEHKHYPVVLENVIIRNLVNEKDQES